MHQVFAHIITNNIKMYRWLHVLHLNYMRRLDLLNMFINLGTIHWWTSHVNTTHVQWVKPIIDFLGQMPLDPNCYKHSVSNALGPLLFISTDDLCIILWNILFQWNSCGDCRQIGSQRWRTSHISGIKSESEWIRNSSADRKLNGCRIKFETLL